MLTKLDLSYERDLRSIREIVLWTLESTPQRRGLPLATQLAKDCAMCLQERVEIKLDKLSLHNNTIRVPDVGRR